jgi:hypothetical protein
MAHSLSHYYQRAKGGIANINGKDLANLGEDYLITGVTGAVLGLISASIGSLDKTVAGMPVPVDGAISMGLGLASLSMRSPELRVASIAAGGSAAARTFEKFFKKAMGAHGEFDGGAFPQLSPGMQAGYGYGWGAEASNDPLLRAAAGL